MLEVDFKPNSISQNRFVRQGLQLTYMWNYLFSSICETCNIDICEPWLINFNGCSTIKLLLSWSLSLHHHSFTFSSFCSSKVALFLNLFWYLNQFFPVIEHQFEVFEVILIINWMVQVSERWEKFWFMGPSMPQSMRWITWRLVMLVIF